MLPSELAKSGTEHAHQRAFFQWLNFAANYGFITAKLVCNGVILPGTARRSEGSGLPELKLMHAIPNGGYRHSRGRRC